MIIGNRIKEVMDMRNMTVMDLAARIPCERSNVYDILKRSTISVELLMKISHVLHHDFFHDLSKEYRTTVNQN